MVKKDTKTEESKSKKTVYFENFGFNLKTLIEQGSTILLGLIVGAALFSGTGGKIKEYRTTNLPELYNTNDLPTQIADLQDAQLSVYKQELSDILNDTSNQEDQNTNTTAMLISNMNNDNSINDFFSKYLSLKYTDKVTTQYQLLSPMLASKVNASQDEENKKDEEKTGSEYAIRKNIYALIGGASWAKETKSQTALSANVVSSLMTGSTDDNRYYICYVPATNDKRDFAILNYIVRTDANGKIVAVSYLGRTQTYKNSKQTFTKMQEILKGNLVMDEDGDYLTETDTSALPTVSESE